MNTWDVLTGSATVPPGALTELAALRAALPGYDVTITSHSRTHRFEATRRDDGPGPWCLISSDPADLWRELADRARPAALDGDPHKYAHSVHTLVHGRAGTTRKAPHPPGPGRDDPPDDAARLHHRPQRGTMTGPRGWQSAAPPDDGPDDPLVHFDATRPNIARAYDYLLGGKTNFAPDRELAERLVAIYPGTRQMVHENRRFLVRALDYVLAQAIHQYVDLGAGLPTSPAVHEIVRRHDKSASVVYADNDPVVLNHLLALATSGDDHDAVAADLVKPAAVLDAVQATGLIDWGKPVCLILAMVLHFLDAATARDTVSAYVSEMAPGSHVIITVACGQPAIGQQITRTYDAAPVYNHTPDDVASFFTGLDLIKPGIADARAWMPGWRTPAPFSERPGHVLAGIGIKTMTTPPRTGSTPPDQPLPATACR